MINFDILNRFSGAVQFTAEIDCAENAPTGIKIGLAVKWAIKNDANLADANLAGAYLADANLAGAYLAGANLADATLAGANLAGAYLADAYLAGANLADATLAGANLAGAYLADAYLISDRIIDGGLRSDGYRFLLTRTEPGEWRIKAGCRNFTLTEARTHWGEKRPAGDRLGDETRLILAHMEALAKLRKWPEGE
jgi:uncharacterized protein YjbI with pentapeptide repeats